MPLHNEAYEKSAKLGFKNKRNNYSELNDTKFRYFTNQFSLNINININMNMNHISICTI